MRSILQEGNIGASLGRVVRDGLLLSVVFSAIIVGTALIDPWIMLENYPPAIRESVTPPDDLPMVLPIVIGVGMIVVLVWLMVRSIVALERERGRAQVGARRLRR